MSGKAPHLCLILNKGSLYGYSIKRDLTKQSNDRGSFILHPEKRHLKPGEKFIISWDLIWFESSNEFTEILTSYSNSISVKMSSIISFKGEINKITVEQKDDFLEKNIRIYKNKKEVTYSINKNKLYIYDTSVEIGEQIWEFLYNNKGRQFRSFAKSLVISSVEELSAKRCNFIVNNQQYIDEKNYLHGAYLPYDNEENSIYYSNEKPDHNAARERLGMGVLIAKYLQKYKNKYMSESLERYTKFIYREVYTKETGEVFNDANRNSDQHRLYNYPWIAIFFMERFHLYGLKEDLKQVYQVIKKYYVEGGYKFYAIDIPMEESYNLSTKNDMNDMANELKDYYIIHANKILDNGLLYPVHEVKYEQSIVAPAVSMLFQVYLITKNEKYLEEGKKQLEVLELFNGEQPDYHMYEVAIRHWDGYWFGKRRLYGDTFPHYWSSLTGNAYYLYYRITKDEEYKIKAENSLRGSLSMFFEDGRATCAYIYPETVNGIKGNFADPCANDQDWGLYYFCKYYFYK
ncbi:MAG: hypothetical protein ACK5LT_12755 [Lachnospirales bacterium]